MPKDDRRNCPIVERRSFSRMVNPLNERSGPATDTGNVQKSATNTFGKSPSKFSKAFLKPGLAYHEEEGHLCEGCRCG